jgi:hypothetical protein
MSTKTTAAQRTAQQAAEAFTRDAADHELTILHDDGLYRHLRFVRMVTQEDGTRKPTSSYWFDVITWPGSLAVNGDMEGFMFSRLTDMFEFFRGHEPNPQYWAEKLQGQPRVKGYSEEVFRQNVLDDYAGAVDCGGVPKGLGRAIREQVLGNGDTYFEQGARDVLDEFEYLPGDAPAVGKPWRFDNTWEWDLTDYTHQFLWCCSAIPWGIGRYDQAKAAAVRAEVAAVAGGVL